MKQIIYSGIFLALISALAGLALSFTYVSTIYRIKLEEENKLQAALKEVSPQAETFKKLSEEEFETQKQSQKIGQVFRTISTGYAGPIHILVGLDEKKKVTGVKILSLTETPGLGLNATDKKFLKQFIGKSSGNKLKAKEDIDALTGATITSQAVCNGIKKVLSN